ncbi:MAG TPA: farnesyl diphosphate synthase [Blastocatellia bacterium]|jgi:geranylgeranyl diphosphate synthase type II|nr:farnesyl diphosphate synthase [Blastocatellia bacterium]
MNARESITDYLARRADEVNLWLECFVPSEMIPPRQLHRAMRYSLLAGGKRLRPALVLAAGEAFGADADELMPAACAIEMIHTYSLIHDDLPAMDNDDLRRGRPTCHKAFGEAVAILAGDALLTQAFRVLASDSPGRDPERQVRVIREIATAAGTVDALIGGQMADIENEGKQVAPPALEYIHRSKTGAMICTSVVVGGVIAGATEGQVGKLRAYGERVGLAFQIADDILDVVSTSEQLGKTPGKDQAAHKATYPALYGVAASEAKARQLVDEAVKIISGLVLPARELEEIARFIIARKS